MTDRTPVSRRGMPRFPSIPRGETVATFESYDDAQKAVDRLGHAEFPVKEVSIIGNDLTSVERVTGTLSYGRAAGAGALSGLWIGLFFGLLLTLLSPTASTVLFIGAAALIGAGFGMFFNIAVYSLNRRRRDFTSVMQVVATSYSVLTSPELANRARNVLEGRDVSPAGQGDAPTGTPPQP
ncbi:general stress protein [Herbiconiux liangxiaofengii]|uniref:general stress protein n=1 Tax=Herbiconiux liangxiaofengii TaxID=3342795 RepID=UPI0035BAF2D5